MNDHVWSAHPEFELSSEDLRRKYEETGDHPEFPKADWRAEVENDDTNLGYWEWVMHRVEAWEEGD